MKQEKKQKQVKPTDKKVEESLSYTVEVRDKEGQVIQHISAPSRSYVQQWNQVINVLASQADKTIKDTGGIDQSIPVGTYILTCWTGIAGIDWGIRVGKGATPVAITDYALETPLGEGTGTDEFKHQAVTFTEPSVVGSTCSFTVKRVLVNDSGATITGIREIGTYIKLSGLNYGLGFRDVLPGAVSVPHGGSITVTYTIAVTV
ncbi:unnamed protein product [marine sediment metagenome]|uniref:Uncharacterized protein n=1 Tax=marine sediment metagenome TaxID=412755 RepID=X1F0Q7_9ZZZZ